MKKVISTEKKPIKMWIDKIDEDTLEQAKHLANLPFAFKHIAIMPDCHLGFGMPIGGVMATKNVIVPNAVGVDIGCFDKDTEFLSPNGWKKISEWQNEKVMQFHPENNQADFVAPIKYIKEKCDRFVHIKTKYGVDQMLSEEHRCLVYIYDRGSQFDRFKVVTAKEIMIVHNRLKNGYRQRFLTTFEPIGIGKINLTNNQLRIAIMVCADGSFNHGKAVVRLKKNRKIERAEKLLKDADIKYTKHIDKNNVCTLRFVSPIVKKGLEQFWNANYEQRMIISDNVIHWDGNEKDSVFFTRKKEEADFVNYIFSTCGYRSTVQIDNRKSGIDYRVFKLDNDKVGINGTPKTNIKYVKSKDGNKYCFTVPSSYLVMRRNGNIFITGNCGMCAVKTSLTDIDRETLKKILGEIRKERFLLGTEK